MNGGPRVAGKVHRAVILAAGQGTRLQPLTTDLPKCLVEVGGEPLLMRTLRSLAAGGVSEAVIVVGYAADTVRERIGRHFAGLEIRYVDAPDFATTNNLRSLWDARHYLDQDILLLEADVAFDDGLLDELLRRPCSSAAVAPFAPPLAGTVVRRDREGRITTFTMAAEQGPGFDPDGTFKTVNIYLLRQALLAEQIIPRLERAVAAGQVDRYYETVLRDAVAQGALADLEAVDVSRHRWYEVDDHRDLDSADFLFSDRDAQYNRIGKLHGSYWRYGFTDHSYLYNMHFPPEALLSSFRTELRQIVTNYPVAQPELARLVANWTGADPDCLAVANGAAELIKILGGGFITRMTIPTPSFNEYEEVVAEDGLNRFPLAAPDFDLDVDAFARSAIAWGSDTAVLVTPNNPTARSVSGADVIRLARMLEADGCRLIVDQSFIEFARDGSACDVEDEILGQPNLVVVKSMSKVFGIAGLRLGYLLSGDRKLVEAVRSALPIWNINGLAESFLRGVGRYRAAFAESCVETRQTCQEFYHELLAMPGLEPVEPDANFVFCRLSDGEPSAPEVARRLYVEHNILIKDCAAKSMWEADRYLRIASRTSGENRMLIRALAQVLNSSDERQAVAGRSDQDVHDAWESRADGYSEIHRVGA